MAGPGRFNTDEHDEEIIHHSFDIVDETQKKGLNSRQKTAIILSVIVVLVIGGIVAVTLYFSKSRPKPYDLTSDKAAPFTDTIKNQEIITENKSLRAGIESYNRGYYTDAITEFNNVVESDAQDRDKSTALIYLGLIEEKRGNLDRALEYYTRARNYDRDNHRVYLYMAGVYRKAGNLNQAEETIKKAVKMKGSDPDTLIMLGNIYYELGRYDDAVQVYRQALEKSPDNGPLLYNTASALLKKGDEFSALEYFKKASATDRIGEVAFRSFSRMGVIYTERKDYEKAIEYLKQALNIRPGDATVHYNLGIAYLGMGKKDLAIDELVKAEELGRNDRTMLEKIGNAYASMNDYNRGLRVYQSLEKTDSRNIRILARLGELHYSKGEYDKSLEYFRKITELKPATESARVAYLNMGNILDDMQSYEDAIAMYKKALTISRKDHMAWYNLGIAYQHNNNPELALESWQESARLKQDNPAPHLAMAKLYQDRGFYDEAEKKYRDITQQWPALQEPHFNIGTIYYKKNRYEYALKAFERVIRINSSNDLARRAYINIGMINAQAGKGAEALNASEDAVKKALLIKPGDPEALYALGLVQAGKNLHRKAVDTFYQALQATRESSMTARIYNSMGTSHYKLGQYRKALNAYTRGLEEDPSNEELRMNRKAAMNAYEKELVNTK